MDDLFNSPQLNASAENAASGNLPSLSMGLAALKRKDYTTAIAQFESVIQTTSDKGTSLKAQMGLVMAHQRLGDIKTAIALCQQLLQSPSNQLREWAAQTLDELAPLAPQSNSEAIGSVSVQIESEIDQSGFVPLSDNRADSSSEEDDMTGFVPLAGSSQATPIASADENAELNSERLTDDNSIDLPHLSTEPRSTTSTSPQPLTSAATRRPISQATSVNRQPHVNRQSRPGGTTASKATALPTLSDHAWRNAGRAQKWSPLGPVDMATLWALEAGTVVALFFVTRALFQAAIATVNWVFNWIRWPIDLRFYIVYYDPKWPVLIGLLALMLVSPWAIDRVLRFFYSARSLTLDELTAASPEAVRLLKRICNQRRLPLPTLRVLPSAAPLAMSYGLLPSTARIAVSRGLLSQLSDDEIATIIAGELGHIARWDFAIVSFVVLAAQLPYLVYWNVANWGDRQHDRVLTYVAIGVSSLSYGIFWVLRWVGLWLSRARLYYSDRTAAETTGNPNGLTRALLKTAIGVANEIQRQGDTGALLESFDLLTPVSHRTALTIGSTYPYAAAEALLEWDRSNPYRNWLAINNSHSPLGDRLHQLALYARHWRLETELDLVTSSKSTRISPSPSQTRRFLLQSAPFLGIAIGFTIAMVLWVIGAIADRLYWFQLSWMQGDPSILWGCILTGFSLGTIVRINAFFPDITRSNLQDDPLLPDLLASSTVLPVDSQPVRLQGKLLGRQGIRNRLDQDLILQSDTGLIKLHFLSKVGPLGNLLSQPIHPTQFINRPVTVTGWFRRGATPWIDVETIQLQQGKGVQSGHPVWSTLLALLAALLATYIILRSGV